MQHRDIRAIDGLRPRHLPAGLLLLLVAQAAGACPPERPWVVVVPYAAGGSVDVTTRIVARQVGHELGRALQVVNVPGASGLLAVRKVLAAERDGCTVLAGSVNTVVIVPQLNPHADFAFDDLKPVGKVGSTDMLLVAGARTGLRDVQALRQAAAAPGAALRAGHPGQESVQAIALQRLQASWQARLIEVPYSGAAQLVTDLVGGHLDIAVLASPAAMPLIQRGAVHLVAALDARSGLSPGSWSGWFVARGVADAALQPLERALKATAAHAGTRQALAELGVRLEPETRADFEREVTATAARLRQQLATSGSAAGPTAR